MSSKHSCQGHVRTGLVLTALAVALTTAAAGTASAAPAPAVARSGLLTSATHDLAPAITTSSRPRIVTKTPLSAGVVVGSELARGASLAPGASLRSPSGRYSLVMGTDGVLSYQERANRLNPSPVSQSIASGDAGSHLDLQNDGNLVLYSSTGAVVLNFGTAGSTAARLVIQDDSNLVLYGAANNVIIDFGFAIDPLRTAGQVLLPGDVVIDVVSGARLLMQTDGNLVVYTAVGVAAFNTGTAGNPGAAAIMQADGNFVVYSDGASPAALFSTGTSNPTGVGSLGLFGPEFKIFRDATVVYGSGWATDALISGQFLFPGDRRISRTSACSLLMQTDGNLVDYCSSVPVFTTRSSGSVFAVMNPNGNFLVNQLVTGGRLKKLFQTNTAGNADARLLVQDDRNLVVYTTKNRPVFSLF